MNRRAPAALADRTYDAFLPDQALDLATALAVLDRDSFAGAPEEIANATVVATYVEGELVVSG